MKVFLLTAAALIGLFGLTGCSGQPRSNTSEAASPAATPASTSPSETAGSRSTDPAAAQPTEQPAAPPADALAVPPAEPPAAQATPPAANPAPAIEGKVHFPGDYTKASPADSAKIVELSKQWHSADKEALFHEKMDGSGLSSNVPPDQAETFYGQAAEACQRRFDGYKPPLEGVRLEIENLAVSVYCPELR